MSFFFQLFNDHYVEHRENCVTVLLPEISPLILYHVIHYVYTSRLDIPSSIYSEVLQLAKFLRIDSLVNELVQNTTKTFYSKKMPKTLDTNIRSFDNVHSSANVFPTGIQCRTINISYKFDTTQDLNSFEMKSKKHISPQHFISNTEEHLDCDSDYEFSSKEKGRILHLDPTQNFNKSSVSYKNEPVIEDSSFWISGSSDESIAKNLIIIEDNNKPKNNVSYSNAIISSQPFSNFNVTQDPLSSVLYPNSPQIEMPSINSSQENLPNLSHVGISPITDSEQLSIPPCIIPKISSNALSLVKKDTPSEVEVAKEDLSPMPFNADSHEEEEEKLKLQVRKKIF